MIHIQIKGKRYKVKLYKLIPMVIILLSVTALSAVTLFALISADGPKTESSPVLEVNTVTTDDEETIYNSEEVAQSAAEPQVMKPANLPENLYDLVISESEVNNIPAEFVLAVMKTETQSFNTDAINYNSNGTYDSGIMQINSSNINWMSEKFDCPEFASNPCDPVANITVGIRYLASIYTAYQQHYGEDITKCILATAGAYNRGVSNQNKYKNIYEYNAKVFAHYSNIANGIDVNIDYAKEMPSILNYLRNEVIL